MTITPPFSKIPEPSSTREELTEPKQAGLRHSTQERIGFIDFVIGLANHRFLIIFMIFVGLASGFAKFLLTPPTYSANAILHIEARETGVSALQPFQEYGEILGGTVSMHAEMRVLQSRTVLSEVADQFKLDIVVSPIYFPYVGEAIARHYKGIGVAKPWFGKTEYAWGGEEISIESFLVPETRLNQSFTLVAGNSGTYQLFSGDQLLLEGEVGKKASNGETTNEQYGIFVSLLKARPGTRFALRRISLRHAAENLRGRFTLKVEPPFSPVLSVNFRGRDPDQTAKILNKILTTYQRLNVERKGAEADKTLAFLEKQTPPLKERLLAAETAYNQYLQEHGSVDVAHETSTILESIVSVESELFNLQQDREKLRERFKTSHPKIQSMDALLTRLQEKLLSLEQRTEELPEVQQTVLKLARDVEVNSSLYSQMVNSLQELRIAKAGTVGNARIIDFAVPPIGAIAPVFWQIILLHTFIAAALALGYVALKLSLRHGIAHPSDIERELSISVLSTIPYSKKQQRMTARANKPHSYSMPLALVSPDDDAIESIRSLRTSLHFLAVDSGSNIALVTGPDQDVGKSFLSVNLAVILAQAGKKVLLIDADMRRGRLHKTLGQPVQPGLSEFIASSANRDEAICRLESAGFDLIQGGTRPPNPSELLMSNHFSELVGWAQDNYDFTIIDAPPVLAVTDAVVISRLVKITILVARAGRHRIEELEQTVKRIHQSGSRVAGFVLNAVTMIGQYGYRYGYRYGYGSQYHYKGYESAKR